MTKEEALRDLAYRAWSFCNSAHRLYPDNKHTFSDYADCLKEDMKRAESAMDEWAESEAISFAEWIGREKYYLYFPGDHDKPEWVKEGGVKPYPSVVFSPTTAELYSLFKQQSKH